MIILDTVNRSLEVVLAGAVANNQLPIVASFADYTTNAYVPTAAQTVTNNTTAVTAVAAPASSHQRQIKQVAVQNADTSSATVTVRYNDNGTTRTLVKVVLAAGSTLQYSDGEGWRVLDANGATVQSTGSNNNLALIAILRGYTGV